MIRFLATLISLTLALFLALVWAIFSDHPAVPPGQRNRTQYYSQSPQNHRLDVQELEEQIVRLLSKFSIPVGVKAEIRGREQVDLTITLTTSLPRPYMNLVFQSTLEGERLRLDQLRVGRVPIPGEVLEWLLTWLPNEITQVYDFGSRHATMSLRNQRHGGTGTLLSPMLASKSRLSAYHRLLSRWSQHPHQSHSLGNLLRALFRLAYQRSTIQTAAAENRALLQIAATYVNRRNPARLFKLDTRHPIRFITLRLHGRYDLAQHFILAAAVASSTNEQVATSMGLYKELADIHSGSGFSFSDLAADKAGAKFGRMATTPGSDARYLQKAMVSVSDETFFMPKVRDMPDHLSREQFETRFSDVDSVAYHRILALIERRIDRCPLYRLR